MPAKFWFSSKKRAEKNTRMPAKFSSKKPAKKHENVLENARQMAAQTPEKFAAKNAQGLHKHPPESPRKY